MAFVHLYDLAPDWGQQFNEKRKNDQNKTNMEAFKTSASQCKEI